MALQMPRNNRRFLGLRQLKPKWEISPLRPRLNLQVSVEMSTALHIHITSLHSSCFS